MSWSSVPNNVYEYVLLELLSVFSCNHAYLSYCFNVVSIYMENRAVNWLSNVGGMQGWSAVLWDCGESDLVVDYNMNWSSWWVVLKVTHLERLIDYSLSSTRCISMDEYSSNLISVLIIEIMLLSSDSSTDNWVYTFQMRWIGKHSH
jgi:hypothetical protein